MDIYLDLRDNRVNIEVDESIKRWSKIIKSRNKSNNYLLKTYYYYDGDINKKYDTYMDKMPYVLKEALFNIVHAKITKEKTQSSVMALRRDFIQFKDYTKNDFFSLSNSSYRCSSKNKNIFTDRIKDRFKDSLKIEYNELYITTILDLLSEYYENQNKLENFI